LLLYFVFLWIAWLLAVKLPSRTAGASRTVKGLRLSAALQVLRDGRPAFALHSRPPCHRKIVWRWPAPVQNGDESLAAVASPHELD
jgi:hypothetical protein